MSMCLIPDVGHSVSLLQYRVYSYIFVQLLANCCLHANKTKSSNRFSIGIVNTNHGSDEAKTHH